LIGLVALYLGIPWLRKHGGLPEHGNFLLAVLTMATLALYVALFHAWRLRREARAEALQALSANRSSHAVQPPAVASPQ